MDYYVFSRNKKNGKKKLIETVSTIEEARKVCARENKKSSKFWYEFTSDMDYVE